MRLPSGARPGRRLAIIGFVDALMGWRCWGSTSLVLLDLILDRQFHLDNGCAFAKQRVAQDRWELSAHASSTLSLFRPVDGRLCRGVGVLQPDRSRQDRRR